MFQSSIRFLVEKLSIRNILKLQTLKLISQLTNEFNTKLNIK